MASETAQDDLYKPLSTEFLVPTNQDIGAIENNDGGVHRAFACIPYTLTELIPR